MANPSVGTLAFVTLRGQHPQDPAMRLGEITRMGVDGHAYIQLGKRGAIVRMVGERDASSPSTIRSTANGMIGTAVTVTFADGSTVTNVMVLDAAVVEQRPLGVPVGGIQAGGWWVAVAFTLQGTKV